MPPSLEIQGRWAKNGGLYPFLSTSSQDPYSRIAHVSFRQRSGADNGAFFDYTSRYGAVRQEADRITLRATLCPSGENLTIEQRLLLEKLVKEMKLSSLMDLPIITLSNGQTRRARIIKAILAQPELLLLDEPFSSCSPILFRLDLSRFLKAGLDPRSRKNLNNVLQEFHLRSSPRILLGLRKGEEVPTWVTHVLEIQGDTGFSRKNPPLLPPRLVDRKILPSLSRSLPRDDRNLVIDLQNVNVSYDNRSVRVFSSDPLEIK